MKTHAKPLAFPAGSLSLVLLLASAVAAQAQSASTTHRAAPGIFNIREYGAKGDGTTLDTEAINQAIADCDTHGGGQVYVPPGKYLSGTIHLRSRVTLQLAAGARLIGSTNLALYQPPKVPAFMAEAKFGNWHRALIVADGAEDVAITGQGVIDGNKVFDPNGEEHMRGPHAIAFTDCRRFVISDLSIVDAANYAIYFQVSDHVDVHNVKITGGWDGVHFRGSAQHPCRDVSITGCRFYTGDDSIAGRFWEAVVIQNCIVNSSCNGIRLIGPARHLVVDHCLFYGPGEQPHRTSNRRNMLSAINLQPGAWDKCDGLLDDVLLANNTMRKVSSPLTLWSRPGNPVGTVTVAGLQATEVFHSGLAVESWADLPITNVVFRSCSVEFVGGGQADQAKQWPRRPGVDVRPLPAWGLFARNLERLTLEDVRFSLTATDQRPVLVAQEVKQLTCDDFRYPRQSGVAEPLVTTNVAHLNIVGVPNR